MKAKADIPDITYLIGLTRSSAGITDRIPKVVASKHHARGEGRLQALYPQPSSMPRGLQLKFFVRPNGPKGI